VEELSEDDLLAAGIPALPLAASAVSRAAAHSASAGADCQRTETVSKDETITVGGLVETPTGFETDVPAETTRRIIAWAMWELPALADERIRSITLNVQPDPALRVFFAVGNFSRGRWEPMGRIVADPSDPDGDIYLLSPGQRYNRSDGPGYLLMAVGHPGNGNMSGYKIELQDILISSFSTSCLAEGFAEGAVGAAVWDDTDITYIINGVAAPARMRQHFGLPQPSAELPFRLLLPQPLNLLSSDEYFSFQGITGDWNGDGRDTIGFYDPAEVNGPRHPYGIHVDAGAGNDQLEVCATALMAPPEGGNRILIGLLLPAVGPRPGATVSILDAEGAVLRTDTTDARGEFRLEDVESLDPGVYSLSLNFETIKVKYLMTLMEEEGIFYYLLDNPQTS